MIWLAWRCRSRTAGLLLRMGWSGTGCLNAVAWLLRQPEDAVTVQELVDLYRSARR